MALRQQGAKEAVKYDIEIKKHSPKRSNDANSYAWELLGQLGKKLKTPAAELYRNYVHDLGIKRTAKIDLDSAKTLIKVWQEKGLAWIAEKIDEQDGMAIVDLYYGSSVYDTKQMARLIDMIVTDCKLQDIDTRTPDEIAQMEGIKEGK